GMPLAAIETGQIDFVLSPDKIGEELKEILQYPNVQIQYNNKPENQEDKSSDLDKLLRLISKRTGTDFSNYKPSTICRRLEKRLAELKLDSIGNYLAYIEKQPEELDVLFQNILIGVTTFFRDIEAFNNLEKHLSKILAMKKKGEQIRIWVPGCASGEEAYSIALLVVKLIHNRIQDYDIQIFATDIDEKAINIARRGVYPKSSVENVPEELLQMYFLKKGEEYEVVKSIRQLILFSRHDVTSNPPFLKLDLISCRNLLIYFGQNLQKHVIPIFHYALNPDGYLFLGKSETVGQFSDLFTTVEGKSKIFQRKRGNYLHAIKFSAFRAKSATLSQSLRTISTGTSKSQEIIPSKMTIPDMVRETLYNAFEHPYVIVNDTMDILEVSGDVRIYLSINPGTMNANILKLANKDLQIELRSVLSKALRDNITCKSSIKKVSFFERSYFVRITAKPLMYAENLFMVIFEQLDIDEKFFQSNATAEAFSDSPRVIELEQELAATKEHLQTFIEELETANEELQSLNEELQSSNEELQSSNEELETSNEELQSTNEELQIAYSELKSASEEIERQAKALLISETNAKALLNNTLQSFVLVGRDYKILAFNKTADDYAYNVLGKRMKVGDSFIDFQVSGEIEQFHKDFSKATKGMLVEGEKVVFHKDGTKHWYKYNFTPVVHQLNDQQEAFVISYSQLDITQQKQVEQELLESEEMINSIFNAADIGICVTDQNLCFVKVNQAYCDLYGYKMEEIIGKSFTIVLEEAYREFAANLHQRFLEGYPETPGVWEVKTKSGEKILVNVTASRLILENGKKFKITTVSKVNTHHQTLVNNPDVLQKKAAD
ncbi:MAG: PAS domain S-box protein, partial [Flammeovirgaceae bacterium]|nr:PAS domain S-box protein [Flammeovirgaceae bacterium]MDW8287617.1 CheR family methyltransferase [Flammeovirgaceae bacterium]